MEKYISCCGLDCATCDARIATIKNDDALRAQTAENWQKQFNASTIPIESINCLGCRQDEVLFGHCPTCKIRVCVKSKGFETCADCPEMDNCEIVAMVHKFAPEAKENLQNLK